MKKIENPVSISRYSPKWYQGPEYKALAPSTSLLLDFKVEAASEEQYVERFMSQLQRLNAQTVYFEITKFYGENATLLCYEKSGDFCHRRLVAKWFETELGIAVPELTF